jgi:hypothetical protein
VARPRGNQADDLVVAFLPGGMRDEQHHNSRCDTECSPAQLTGFIYTVRLEECIGIAENV